MLAVSTTIEGPVRRVMVGTDRSETAERAVRWAAGFAERFDADLYVVQVIMPEHPADTEYGAAERTQAGAAATISSDTSSTWPANAAGRTSWCTTTPRWRS